MLIWGLHILNILNILNPRVLISGAGADLKI